ncbi:MAG TPA: hypothetical protein VM935_02120 [Chitinophagaceae bacterium]|nr:hypothetical protein [Chitinophagaceae bacterium]
MRRQIIILALLSFLLLLFTTATVSCLKDGMARTTAYCAKNERSEKSTETLWDVITRQLIGAVSLSR